MPELFKIFVVRNTTTKSFGARIVLAPIVVCVWLSVSSTIFQPEIVIAVVVGLKSSTHSGMVESLPVLGINSLIMTDDAARAGAVGTYSASNSASATTSPLLR